MNILLVDTSNLVARYNYSYPLAQTRDGFPTGGLYGTVRHLRRFLGTASYDAVVCALDAGRPKFRMELCPEYKQQREDNRSAEDEKMYQRYRQQVDVCHELFCTTGMVTARVKGWEGDDVIAALALRRFADHTVTIISSDRDFTQLVSDDGRVKLWDLGKDRWVPHDATFCLKRCLDPKASDNLDGVPGVGPKKADWLVEKAGGVTKPSELLTWCSANAENPSFTKGQLKIVNAVLAEQQKVRANWKCTKLSLNADLVNESLKFRRSSPSLDAFTAACDRFGLMPLLEDLSAIWPPFSRLRCPV
jgi:5'-3' exonuclease